MHINHRRETREQVAAWHCGYSGRDAHLYRRWQRRTTQDQRNVQRAVRGLAGASVDESDVDAIIAFHAAHGRRD